MSAYTREDIITAIKQATADDGGKPVGRVRFKTLTGIPPSAWLGVHWASWSEALREAGFEPNARYQRRDHDAVLIEAALMVRRLGKVPTEPEWRMARRTDSALPSRTALRAVGGRR